MPKAETHAFKQPHFKERTVAFAPNQRPAPRPIPSTNCRLATTQILESSPDRSALLPLPHFGGCATRSIDFIFEGPAHAVQPCKLLRSGPEEQHAAVANRA